MFIHINPHFKTGQYINLSQTRTGSLGLSHFRIERSQLPINRGPHNQVSHLFAENGQRFLGSLIRLFILLSLLIYSKWNPV